MSCAVHLFLAGLCSLPSANNQQDFDLGRFGPISFAMHTKIVARIDGAFDSPGIQLSYLQRHLGYSKFELTELKLESDRINGKQPILDIGSAKLAYAHVNPRGNTAVDPASVVKKDKMGPTKSSTESELQKKQTNRRRNILAMFRTRSKAPSGVDVRKSGYRAVKIAALRHGVDVNFALSVAKQESRGNCKARSHANAKGVMQVVPGTARKHGVRRSNRLYDCKVGADIGVRELKSCLKKAKGNKPKALACYNAGPGWITSKKYRGKRLPGETRDYIKKITGKNYARVR